MALMYSENIDKEMSVPDFTLPGVDGKTYNTKSFDNYDAKVFLFICNHCPYVKAIEHRLIQTYKELKSKNVQFIGICSNDGKDYPEDSFESIQKSWVDKNYEFPYLYDESQAVAKSFGAICTPDIFAFNNKNKLFYRGRLDDSWKDESKVQRADLKTAIICELEKTPLPFEPVPSMGCSIKWKS